MTDVPAVGVVVVNFNGGELTIECLQHLLATSWPSERLEVVLVDNASEDGIASRVRHELPEVRCIESPTNLGFAGGCNLGMRALPESDFIALVNNDATVDRDWLVPLVQELTDDDDLGAVCPRILFATKYRELSIDSPVHRRGRGDRRDLGVQISGARVDGREVFRRAQFVEGFWGPEPGRDEAALVRWTGPSARLRLPSSSATGDAATLLLAAAVPQTATVHCGSEHASVALDLTPRWFDVPFAAPAVDIVNNVGTILTSGEFGTDRGFLEPDSTEFDKPVDVFAWCGAAVLLRRAYLDQVGMFDEQLFLYYEDFELSWRGARCGWRYRYVPTSKVRHVHSATTVSGSRLARYFDDRNRLLVFTRHGTRRRAVEIAARFLLVTGSFARRDLVAPLLHGRRPRGTVVAGRLHAFAGFVWRLPSVLARRHRDRLLVARVTKNRG